MTTEVLHDLPPPPAVGGGRAEIDTSAPFESVREAVDRFGGSAAWSSHIVRRIFAHHKKQDLSVGTEDREQCVALEEQTAQLEKELGVKERETLDVLKELEAAKRIIADLKLKIQKETAHTLQPEPKHPEENSSITTQVPAAEPEERLPSAEGKSDEADVEMCGGLEEQESHQHPASVLMELVQAKSNLSKTTCDLAAIRASIDSLRNDIAIEKMLVESSRDKVSSDAALVSSLKEELDQTTQRLQTLKDLQKSRCEDPSDIFIEIKKMTSEIEQLRNAANASKSEAMMLTAEIEQTRATIGTAEVRCLAAKKMEAAARAAEALALAEIKALLSSEASAENLQGTEGVNISVEEYFELASKARDTDDSSRSKIAAAIVDVDEANQSKSESLTRLEEAKLEVEECKNALQEALKRVNTANRGKFAVEETIRRCRSETTIHKKRLLRDSPRFKHAAHRHKDSRCTDIVDVSSSSNSLKPTLSIGQILSMKLMGPDGYDKNVSDDMSETSNVSLGQILNRRQRILYNSDTTSAANKKFSGKRKKFAFTGLSVFLAKQAKSKKKRESD